MTRPTEDRVMRFPSSFWRCSTAAVALLCSCLAGAASAQSAENVAIVINDNSPDSQRIGEYYARTRSLPAVNVIRIQASKDETVDRASYVATIEGPISAAIVRAGIHDRVLYLVLTKGVPLRISGTTGLDGTLSSVDSELTLLYRRMTGQAVATAGKIDNPYFLGARELRTALPFSHREHDIYLVTRIDAFTVDQAIALVDRAQKPGTDGRILLRQDGDDATRLGNQWIAQAATRLGEQGQSARTVVESITKPAGDPGQLLGFYLGGAPGAGYRQRATRMDFVPGSIAATLVSTDARTFASPPDNWAPSNDPATFFAGSADPLVGDFVRDGVTGVAGQIGEPYLLGAVRPEILFPAYVAGFNLAEAFYLATPVLSWKAVVVGDPLLRPFVGRSLTSAELEEPIDERTGLPRRFASRRVVQAALASTSIPEAAVVLGVRAETLFARGDKAGARSALEEAVKSAPAAVGFLVILAQLEESDGLYPAAIGRYRRIIEIQPTNVLALNNLAYALAVRSNLPAEGLPLAKQAAALAPQNGDVLDTWAWIEHLVGNDAGASKIVADAIKVQPQGAELRLHSAVIAAALGDRAKAESELKEALRLDPALEQRDETRRVRERISALPPPKP